MQISDYFRIVDSSYGTENNETIESEIKRACSLARENEGEGSAVYASMLSELGGFYRGLTSLLQEFCRDACKQGLFKSSCS